MIYPENIKIYKSAEPFELELGGRLSVLQIAYHTFGQLNANRDNVVWVYHALTANSDPVSWWAGLIGAGCPIDTNRYFVVCANVLGSYYGSTNPRSINLETGEPYGINFPDLTVRDVVRAHDLLRQYLGIEQIHLGIGGSFGGHQLLEHALLVPEVFERLFLLATSARETAWSIAIHEAQRMAIETDPTWRNNTEKAGSEGLKTARAVGLLSYRTIEAYIQTQTDEGPKIDDFRAASYVRYQGLKLERRFHAHCYWHLTKCLDRHHVGRGRGGIEAALQQLKMPATVLGIRSDILIPTSEQQFLAKALPNAQYVEIDSAYGHDGFLLEVEQIGPILAKALPISSSV